MACPFGAKTGKARCEHMFSASPLKAAVAQRGWHVRFVPMTRPVPSLHWLRQALLKRRQTLLTPRTSSDMNHTSRAIPPELQDEEAQIRRVEGRPRHH